MTFGHPTVQLGVFITGAELVTGHRVTSNCFTKKAAVHGISDYFSTSQSFRPTGIIAGRSKVVVIT